MELVPVQDFSAGLFKYWKAVLSLLILILEDSEGVDYVRNNIGIQYSVISTKVSTTMSSPCNK